MDLNLLPLVRRDGQDESSLPELHVANPPRRAARSRQTDRLILYFILEGNAPLTDEQQEQLLNRLAQTYYKTPGSVTAALRSVAEVLNDYLLDRNLRSANTGRQAAGLLALVALRGEAVFLAQCGPVQAYLIKSSGAEHLLDSEAATRGLGIGKATPIRYFQTDLHAGDTLLISHQPPPTWNPVTLIGLHSQGLDGLRRRLLNLVEQDLKAVLLQAKTGPGEVHLLQPQSLPASPARPIKAAPQSEFEPEEAGPAPLPTHFTLKPEPGYEAAADPAPPYPVEPAAASFPARSAPVTTPNPMGEAALSPAEPASRTPASPEYPAPAKSAPARKPVLGALLVIGGAFGRVFRQFAQAGQVLVQRMLPGEDTIPSSVMALFAIAIPLMVVTVATVVYFERGRAAQYEAYYAQAAQIAQQTQSETDLQARRTGWETVIAYLDRAESYQTTEESESLRLQAQSFFDELEGVTRLDFKPAITGGVPGSFEISQIVAMENDLYLLDANSGSVARAETVGQVYEMDDTFQCGPGFPAGQGMGPIIDIAPLPKGNELNATIMAMDAQGNLLQCIPGEPPVLSVLAPPPTNWGSPQAFTLDTGNLYVLDPQTNAVWVYWSGTFTSQPQFFFSEDVPSMQDVVDLAVDKSDLYLLHADGHLTLCTFSNLGVSPTRCTDPAPYSDSRTGREGQMLLPQSPFTQIKSTQPPDPSLYLLESESQAIYHFSLRLLTFQRQFRSQNPLADTPATAFALSPDARLAFMALKNQVYYAGMP